MKKILSIACIIAAAVTFSSCKDFLDVKPSNQGDSSTSISSESDAEVMINGLMSKMSSSSYYGRDFLLYGDAKGGDVTIFTAGFGGNDLYYFSHSQTGGHRFITVFFRPTISSPTSMLSKRPAAQRILTTILDRLLPHAV